MSEKLIDFLVPNLDASVNVSTDVIYGQLDELRELYVAARSEPANPTVAAMLEAVINWAEQTEG